MIPGINPRNSSPDLPEIGAQFTLQLLRHEREMRALILSLVPGCPDVDDILQEASMAMWRRFEDYDASRPFVAWALGYVRMQVRSWLDRNRRRKARLSDRAMDEIGELFIAQHEADHPASTSPRTVALEHCLDNLAERDRRLLRLRHHDGHSVREIADSGEFSSGLEALYKTFARLHQRLLNCIQRRIAREP